MEISHNRGKRQMHISHDAPYLTPKILHNLCFSREKKKKNKAYAKFGGEGGGQIRCIMGDVQVAFRLCKILGGR